MYHRRSQLSVEGSVLDTMGLCPWRFAPVFHSDVSKASLGSGQCETILTHLAPYLPNRPDSSNHYEKHWRLLLRQTSSPVRLVRGSRRNLSIALTASSRKEQRLAGDTGELEISTQVSVFRVEGDVPHIHRHLSSFPLHSEHSEWTLSSFCIVERENTSKIQWTVELNFQSTWNFVHKCTSSPNKSIKFARPAWMFDA